MFCRNCGKEMSPTQAFCSSCGAKADNSPIQYAPPPVQNYNNAIPNQNIQYYTTVPNQPTVIQIPTGNSLIKHIFCGSMGIIALIRFFILGLIFIVPAIMFQEEHGKHEMFMFLIVLGIICFVLGFFFFLIYVQRYCDVKTNSIGGKTFAKSGFLNEKFEINYTDIVYVKKDGSSNLIIQTKYNKIVNIRLPRKEIDYVYGILLQKINVQVPY